MAANPSSNPRKKKTEDDDEDENPSDFDDDFYDLLDEQFRKIFQQFTGMFPPNFDKKTLKRMFREIMRQMNITPDKLAEMQDMDPEVSQKMMANNPFFKRPFVFGMNFRVGQDGKPVIDSFGNLKTHPEGDTEVKIERDPLVDIYEEGPYIVVVAEVPGVDKSNIELRASIRELEILAESSDSEAPPRKYHKIVPLPTEINPDVAKARYTNGILEVRLEKIQTSMTKKKIDIE